MKSKMIKLHLKVDKILSAQNKNQITRNGKAFTKSSYKAYANKVQEQLNNANINIQDLSDIRASEAFDVEVVFLFRLPKGTSLKQREALHRTPCLKKTDLDNCNKFVQDEVFKYLKIDDSKVCKLLLQKMWIDGEHDEIKIKIKELGGK